MSASWTAKGRVFSLDFECESWDRFVLGVVHEWGGQTTLLRSEEEVRDWYKSTEMSDTVLSYYGGGYDFLFLISIFPEAEWSTRLAGSSLVSCRIKGHAECRDAARLYPGGLADWTDQKTRLDKRLFPCECEERFRLREVDEDEEENGCGGYCAIRRKGMSRAQWRALEAYAVNDARILLDQYMADNEWLQSLGFDVESRGGKPRLTMGGVAWATAARLAGIDPKSSVSWEEYDGGKRAYYGGRNEVGCVRAPRVERYDMNAMYPWALRQAVPIGTGRMLRGPNARRAYRERIAGAYRAELELPDDELPALPHRYAGTTGQGRLYPGRLVWSTGFVKGWYTLIELENAERHGAKIRTVTHARVYLDCEPCFEPYIDFVYGLRSAAKNAGRDREARRLKWLANAPSGKLAQHPEQAQVKVLREDDHQVPREGWRWLGGRVWALPSIRRVPPSARPIMAAYLTSRGRVELFQRLHRHMGRWAYCDTDSTYLTVRDDRDVHDSRLGAFKYEGGLWLWRCPAPKLYSGIGDDGSPVVKAKGMSDVSWEGFTDLLAGGSVTNNRGVNKLRSSKGRFERRVLTRTNKTPTDRAGTRIVLPNGRTRPLRRSFGGKYE